MNKNIQGGFQEYFISALSTYLLRAEWLYCNCKQKAATYNLIASRVCLYMTKIKAAKSYQSGAGKMTERTAWQL